MADPVDDFEWVVRPQIDARISRTLSDMLGSRPNFEPNESAVEYVLRRLWVDDHIYQVRVGRADDVQEE